MAVRRLSAERIQQQQSLSRSNDTRKIHDDNDDDDDDDDYNNNLDSLSDDLALLDEISPSDQKSSAAAGGMSYAEKRNIFFLFSMYLIHAVPLSFSWATLPILLRQKLNYSQVGTFLVSQYPYSIKVLWSPIVEALRIPGVGRRKSWIVPSFLVVAVAMLWLGMAQDRLVDRIAGGESFAMAQLVGTWLVVMASLSVIRIALDSWSLDLLSQPNVHWASTAVTIGETTAAFIAFNLFLGFSAYDPKKTAAEGGSEEISTHFFYTFWAIIFVMTGIGLLVLNREGDAKDKSRSLRTSYRVMLNILSIRPLWTLFAVHMVSMIGFQTNDAISVLQLVKYKFSDRDIALLATLAFPFQTVGGIYIAKAFHKHHPLRVWRFLFPMRLLNAFVTQLAVLFISKYQDSRWSLWVMLIPNILSATLEVMMFVCLVAFHVQISDPRYGGIYVPLLATTLNLRYDTLGFIYTKTIGLIDGSDDITKPTGLIDGYQIVNFVTVVVAVPVFIWFMRPATKKLQLLDPSVWRISVPGEEERVQEYRMVSVRDDADHEGR